MTDQPAQSAGASTRALFLSSTSPMAMARGARVAFGPDEGEGGGFSVEDAVAALDAEPDDGAAAAPDAKEAAEAAEEPNSEAGDQPAEDAPGEAETPAQDGDEAKAEPEAVVPAEPPKYWSQEAKAKFLELPPELQAVVLAQEGPRETATAKAKDEAAQARAAADKELQGVQRFAEEIKPFLAQAVQTFRSRWGDNPDWVAYAQENGAEAMSIAKAQFEHERTQLQQVAQASKTADEHAEQAYFKAEFEALQTIAPDLADPETGPAKRQEVTKYLVDLKIPPAQIRTISAVEMSIARKAMLWDQAQAKAAPTPAPKPAPAATRPLARGSAPAGLADPNAKAAQATKARFVKSGSIDDAVAFLNASGD